MKKYYVYIMTNFANTVIYTGVTNNLFRRVNEHKIGENISSFCVKYKIDKLVWFQEFSDVNDAIEGEKTIKGWKREKKIVLIVKNNSKFVDLMSEVEHGEDGEDSSPAGSE